MKHRITFGFFLALSSLTSFLAQPEFAAKDRMVVVISLDGFPGFVLEDPKAPVPTLRRLMQNGTWSRMATVNPTITWPFSEWASPTGAV